MVGKTKVISELLWSTLVCGWDSFILQCVCAALTVICIHGCASSVLYQDKVSGQGNLQQFFPRRDFLPGLLRLSFSTFTGFSSVDFLIAMPVHCGDTSFFE